MVFGYTFPVWHGDSVRTLDEPPMEPLTMACVIAAYLVFVVVGATVLERSHGRRATRTRTLDEARAKP